MVIKYNIIFICLLQLTIASAQPRHIEFTSLTSRDGLLSNSVSAILKDRYGWIWFATDDGLNKYDGTNFTIYRHKTGDTTSLRANEILALHEDRSGNLWVGTSGGALSLFDRSRDNFINYPAGSNIPGLLPNAVITSICSDYLGNIWIAQYESLYVLQPATRQLSRIDITPSLAGDSTDKMSYSCVFEDSRHRIWAGTDKGLFLYMRDTHSFKRFRHDSNDQSSLVQDRVKALAEDKAGHLWVGTEEGLCMMRPNEDGFIPYREIDPANALLGRKSINAIAVDKDGMIWVGTMEGLSVIDPKSGHSVAYLPEEGSIHSLTSKAIRSICIDKEGIYWFGTYRGGVNKYDKNLNLFNLKLNAAFSENGTGNSIITSFAERSDGSILLGTDGDGIKIFDRPSEKLRPFSLRLDGKILSPLSVLALKVSREKVLYIGTYGNGLIMLDPRSGKTQRLLMGDGINDLNSRNIFCISEDSKGRILLGTNGDGVKVLEGSKVVGRYTPRPKAPGDIGIPVNGYIRAIQEDTDGNIWIGSHGGGIAVCDPRTGRCRLYDQNNSRLPSDKVQAFLLDSKGQMWVGTYGGGLSVFDKSTGQFSNFSEKDSLQNTTIYQVLEDAQGHIWVSTNTGLSSLDVHTRTFRNFSVYNGVQNNNFIHASGMRMSDGELFFGGLQGFNYFNPADLTTNRNVPTVVLIDLKVSNRSVTPGAGSPIKDHISVAREVRLDYKQNFALSFVALNYTIPMQNHYAYKLEGFDKDWNYTGAMNTAYYTNLDPGDYIFHVKASNNDGVWSATDTSVRIYVKPPFWRTFYAYLIYLLAAGGLLLYSRYRGISKLRRKFVLEQERQETGRRQELDRLKLKFLTNLSHEFRTPISLIMGPVDQLLSTRNDQQSQDSLQMIKRNGRRLLNLVSQLLDFRKMEEQELSLQLSEGELVAFARDIYHSFQDLSERKNITFVFDSDINRLDVTFDRDKIERILFNLLSNAFKFTLEGGAITLALREIAGGCEPSHTCVSIQVIDTGIGIPPDKKDLIFQRFFQHAAGGAILNQGTGIGLSITREFVTMHGGTIDVESHPGQGSVFTIRLPLITARTPQTNENSSTQSLVPVLPDTEPSQDTESTTAGGMEKDRISMPIILLVEDNEDFRFYLKDNLRNNYRILEAANGKEGWQKALSGHPQLIVSDVDMPSMDGILLTRKLKADKRTMHIPVILLTALTGEGPQLKGLETGANDYITKPFSFEVLNAKIKNLLELGHTLKTTYTRQIKVLSTEVGISSEDEQLIQKVARYIEENLTDERLSVEVLSRHVGMSRSSLYNKLLEITGQTPVEYIRTFKLERAAILLEKSDLTIAEVAYKAGFSTPNYFARTFKSRFNMLPSEYAARIRKGDGNNGL